MPEIRSFFIVFRATQHSLDGKEALYDKQEISFAKKQKFEKAPSDYTGIISQGVSDEDMVAALALGNSVAQKLLRNGAKKILDEAKAQNSEPPPR